ncbi:adenosine deaminase [Roseomonas sp. E05]|uniref:adenosine deaminase n=1 Tax=Roseomonas sp. E05 TaxID=3046310 RepID=UPI0024BAD0EF|nr:adenosine deaminase [Roseomonas sp. E05]MDJ0388763.1 adenosine deaminase [Roseomonas sp. E05]
MHELSRIIRGMPKSELHLHLEGSIEPELTFRLAERNKVRIPFESVEQLRQAYAFADLQSFLKVYYAGTSVLLKAEDFYDMTRAYLERVALDNVIHTEVFLGPQAHLDRGIAIEAIFEGVIAALDEWGPKLGMSTALLLILQRHQGEEAGTAAYDRAMRYRERIAALGIGGIERGHPPANFARLFARARAEGLHLLAHAGEEGPAEYVAQAVDILGVDRVDHGVRCEEDPALVRRLAEHGIPLTVCPLSNVKLGGVARIEDHNFKRLLDAGVKVTMNSDDPSYFGGYMTDNYLATAEGLGLTVADLHRVAANGFEAAFVPEADRRRMLAALDRFWVAEGLPLPAGATPRS